MTALQERLADIRQRMADAARRAGRAPDDVRLIAVSKRQPLAAVQALAALGQTAFGESQVQEALDKIEACRALQLEWHFIGHLQSNKTRFVPGNFHWVHAIDTAKLAQRIDQAAAEQGAGVRLLLQVNVDRDPAKHGVHREGLFALVDEILEMQLRHVSLHGLMTIGRRSTQETELRRGFAALRELLQQCRTRFGDSFSELSMGMSGDYALAIEEGATLVRVGTALFGERRD